MITSSARARTVVREADDEQREAIYRIRHDVYAVELGQHPVNAAGRLTDRLDDVNHYLVALRDGEVAAFVSVTAPNDLGYSVDKYVRRDAMPFEVDDGTYEIRLLTVLEQHRDTDLAATLMVAAYRWIEARGGRTVIAIGRDEVTPMYVRGGMRRTGITTTSPRCGRPSTPSNRWSPRSSGPSTGSCTCRCASPPPASTAASRSRRSAWAWTI